MDPAHLQLLALIARHGSLAGAAHALGRTPAAITQRVTMKSVSIIDRWTIPAAAHVGAELTPGYFDRLAAWFKRVATLLPPRTTP